jgi:transposase
MFFPETQVRVFLYGMPCDMRKSFNGLIGLSKHAMNHDPQTGHLFVFVNRRGNYLKALYWDRSGFCIWAKRLEQGNFISNWKRLPGLEMDCTQLKLLIEGIEKKSQKKRYKSPV